MIATMYLQEVSLILLQILFIYFFFSNSILGEKISNKIINTKYFTNLDLIIINIIIFLNFLIFVSVLTINSTYFFYAYIILICLTLIKKLKKKIKILD